MHLTSQPTVDLYHAALSLLLRPRFTLTAAGHVPYIYAAILTFISEIICNPHDEFTPRRQLKILPLPARMLG